MIEHAENPGAAELDEAQAEAGVEQVEPGSAEVPGAPAGLPGLADEAALLVREWLRESAQLPPDPSEARLAAALAAPETLAFALDFVDGVMRPDDLAVAAANLEKLAELAPDALPAPLRSALRAGGTVGQALPWAVVPLAKRALRQALGHLVIDATPSKLADSIAELTADGSRLTLTLLGDPVLGDAAAAARLEGILALVQRDDVDAVSLSVRSVAANVSLWAFDETVERVAHALVPLYRAALPAAGSDRRATLITLDIEQYCDLDLTIAVFERVLGRPEFLRLEAAIVLQAYLPEALGVLQGLQRFSAARVERGGAPITVRLVKGANLAGEVAEAGIQNWPLATFDSALQTDTNFKRLLDWALTPARLDALRIGIATHNLFDIAFAWLLAERRGVTEWVHVEMLSAVASLAAAHAQVVARHVGGLTLYVPVVHPREFDAAVAHVVGQLGGMLAGEGFLPAALELGAGDALFDREQKRFLASVRELASAEELSEAGPGESAVESASGALSSTLSEARPNRTQNRLRPDDLAARAAGSLPRTSVGALNTTPNTDPALAANREWAAHLLSRVPDSTLGSGGASITAVDTISITTGALDELLDNAAEAGASWGAEPPAVRAAAVRRGALALEANRDRLVEVLASEVGATIGEADLEVSEAVDAARLSSAQADEVGRVDGARFVSPRLLVVLASAQPAVSLLAANVLGALAAGAAVIVSPAPEALRSATVLVEALWEAGIRRELVTLFDFDFDFGRDEYVLERALATHPAVDRVLFSGSHELAVLLRSGRHDLRFGGEIDGAVARGDAAASGTGAGMGPATGDATGATAGVTTGAATGSANIIVVTPSADLDHAVADIVASAFDHAGQARSAVHTVILVGSVAKSARFRRQLVDAVTSLRVGTADDPATQVGPLVAAATGAVLQALTTLGPGEHWLVEPRQLDTDGALWSPGVRTGVAAGSEFQRAEHPVPVLGLVHVATLTEAIELQNSSAGGLTGRLHSLDALEVRQWVAQVSAGTLNVNRGMAGAVLHRQPVGGWNRASIGPAAPAGGPDFVASLVAWQPEEGVASSELSLAGLETSVAELLTAATAGLDWREFDAVRRAAVSDEQAWQQRFAPRDRSLTVLEMSVLRYRPVAVVIRVSEGEQLRDLVRLLAAATRAGSPLALSTAFKLPRPLRALLKERHVRVFVEDDSTWLQRAAVVGDGAPRIRMLGGDPRALADALGGSPDVAVYSGPATLAGRVELLPFLRQQTVTVAAHRAATLARLADGLL
ncbi:proline dehydrogenase family protein [Subtercola vilae]|uniref:proline dehydrogenase family protein n=1 Tax=Subtercola vilae TaxID=2056433 RepID=UPI00191F2C3B|nr:proline dehydrogenase family protein [Subtercola vilae]